MRYCAVSIVAKETADLVDVEPPADLGPHEVRGRTLSSLISPGTELAWNYRGDSFPSFPGYAAAFVAEELGPEVTGVRKGDSCFCMGPHRSFQQVDARTVHLVPEGVPHQKAVVARLMGVSMTTLMTTSARPGDQVMLFGAGPVGFLAAQIFARSGYDVIVVEPDASRRRWLEQSGISQVYGGAPADSSGLAGSVALAMDCSGHEQAVLDACRMVRKRGEVVLVGVPWQRQTEAYAHELLSLVFHRYVVLRSGWEWELPRHSTDASPHSIHSGFETALRWLASGSIKMDGLITLADPANAQQTYQDILHRRAKGLFTVFDWSE
ncbi:MAG: dehydrogenase [Puniceicoccaceae bacterium]|nr:MAG: dehydrogenase [Puniceicoccaceae bacterium]